MPAVTQAPRLPERSLARARTVYEAPSLPWRPSVKVAGPLVGALRSWTHFTQGRDSLPAAFDDAGLADRLHLPEPDDPKELTA